MRVMRHEARWAAVVQRALLELATADDIDGGMTILAEISRELCGAASVEWREDGRPRPRVVVGDGRPGVPHRRFSLGPAGAMVVVGGQECERVEALIAAVRPIVRRRYAEEGLARASSELARHNEALEEFAALVAHELKTPLQAALAADDASTWVRQALDLVDHLLEAARDGSGMGIASPGASLEEAVRDLGPVEIEVASDLPSRLPLPPTALRVLLRNLLGNAVAAGARSVRVSATRSSGAWLLVIEDNGAGVDFDLGYRAGSGLGLRLCRRIAGRYGGSLVLAALPAGGTQARLLFREAA
jgi:signal transduction histidine kinase